jgi:hypothetical protein
VGNSSSVSIFLFQLQEARGHRPLPVDSKKYSKTDPTPIENLRLFRKNASQKDVNDNYQILAEDSGRKPGDEC